MRKLTTITLAALSTRGTLLLGFLLPCLLCTGTRATDVSGTIIKQTWTTNGSPYRVVGNILVAGLTIKPGVTVLFTNNYAFEVAGKLTAKGTPVSPIVFMGTNGGWQGIYFNNSSPGSVLCYCIISNSVNSGIRILNTSPVIKNSDIVFNTAQYGGGINIDNASANLTLKDCRIANNRSQIVSTMSTGGGVCAIMHANRLEMTGCTVSSNYANANSAYGWSYGGGIYVSGHSSFKNCIVSGNTCKGREQYNVIGGMARGGGVFSSGGNIVMNNCIVSGNTAWNPTDPGPWQEAYGGGLCLTSGSLLMTNCIIQGNVASAGRASDGAGLCIGVGSSGGSGSAQIVNSTFAYNNTQAAAMGSGSSVTFLNSIVYFNAAGGTQVTGTADVTYSDVQGGFTGVGNINVNPVFLSTADLIIVPGSLCANAGSTNAAYKDLLFPPSLPGSRNDMGAHGGPAAGARMEIDTWPQIEVRCFGCVPGYNYLIQASSNLVDWETVQQFQATHLGYVADYLEPLTNALPRRCYRLSLAP